MKSPAVLISECFDIMNFFSHVVEKNIWFEKVRQSGRFMEAAYSQPPRDVLAERSD